jgi:hypothetical protein
MANEGTGMVMVIWQCDKDDCEELNRRWIELNTIIFDDVCEFCNRKIHEPLTEIITNVNGEGEE